MFTISGDLEPVLNGGKISFVGVKGLKRVRIPIPIPLLLAETNIESTNTSETTFKDKYKNRYTIKINSSLDKVLYEIKPIEIISKKHVKLFRKNIRIFFLNKSYQDYLDDDFSFGEIKTGYNKRLYWSNQLISKGFFDISIAINVSSIETLLKDIFRNLNPEIWFHHIKDDSLNAEILQFLKIYNLKDFYLKELLNYQTIDRTEKLQLLSDISKKNLKNLNFQEIEGQGSYNWLIKKVLDIDIVSFLQSEKVLNKNLKEHLKEMYTLRHKIIHGVETENHTKEIANLYNIVTNKISTYIIKEMTNLDTSHTQ